jgi:hypothetical protein
MTIQVQEGRLILELEDGVQVRHWDKDHLYRRGLQLRPDTKAVDFCLRTPVGSAVLLEVTNYGEATFDAISLVAEVAEKVRDTIAGMVWACQRALPGGAGFESFARPFVDCSTGEKLAVVLWLESDRPMDLVHAGILAEQIRLKLRPWIYVKVTVTNRAINELPKYEFPWLRGSRSVPPS